MGAFETWENVHYPNAEQDEYQRCTFCGGKGYREFPMPLEDPDWDVCPNGCEEVEPPPVKVAPLEDWMKDVLKADREPEQGRRNREIARLMVAVQTVKTGRRKQPVRTTRTRKPTPTAEWVGDKETGYWRYKMDDVQRVIVAGSRDITDRELIRRGMNWLWTEIGPYEVVSGMARGVDQIAAEVAKEAGIKVHEYPADWDRYKKAAGYVRNREMADNASVLLAFWDGESKGTEHMIGTAQSKGLRVIVRRTK